MTLLYSVISILIFTLSAGITRIVIAFSHKYKFCDIPNPPLKDHKKNTPLLGGIAIFITVVIAFLVLLKLGLFTIFKSEFNQIYGLSQSYFNLSGFPNLLKYSIPAKNIIGIFIASMVLLVGGILDDKYRLKPKYQFIFPLIAAIIVISAGVGIRTTTNPLYSLGLSSTPLLNLAAVKFKIITISGIPYYFSLFTDLFTFIWLLGMMYTTKFLDGLDGLVSGISAIGFILLFAASIILGQPLMAVLALIFAAGTLGFLIWNFNPSKIFLGEFGSLWLGFILGIFAILGTARVSITLLILGIPILDVFWIILRRAFYEKKSPFLGDRKHLHFRLLNKGLSTKKTVLFLYTLSASFGFAGLFLQTRGRILALILLILLMMLIGFWISKKGSKDYS